MKMPHDEANREGPSHLDVPVDTRYAKVSRAKRKTVLDQRRLAQNETNRAIKEVRSRSAQC